MLVSTALAWLRTALTAVLFQLGSYDKSRPEENYLENFRVLGQFKAAGREPLLKQYAFIT